MSDAALARAAGITWAARNDDAELRGHNIQPFADIFADDVPLVTAVAGRAFRIDDLFNARQVFLKRAPVNVARAGLAADLSVKRDAQTRQVPAAHGRCLLGGAKGSKGFRVQGYKPSTGWFAIRPSSFAASLKMSLSKVKSDTARRSRWLSFLEVLQPNQL